jgi:hypothetical protein
VTLALFAVLAVFGPLGCGSSGGGSSAEAVIAVDPVDLAPGQTLAQLAWPASEGPIDNYLVFESRNGGAYEFSQVVTEPTAEVSGQPGDSIRVTVIGVSPTGEASESSPPSPPLIFHAAEAAAAVAQAASSGVAPVGTTEAAPAPAATDETTEIADAAHELLDETQEALEADDVEGIDEEATSPITRATRALLLGADARLPGRELSSHASQWLQAQVDQEIAAGVSLVGTGRRNEDALRELVWRDHAGQLFVSDGQSLLDSDDLATTFDEAFRLGTTERFVGLADFDGDGQGDWLFEDTSTGEVWMVGGAVDGVDDGESDLSLWADPMDAETQFAGQGDFDGDGRAELLWLGADNGLLIARPGGEAPTLDPAAIDPAAIHAATIHSATLHLAAMAPDGFETLAIADFDGDGRDDLLGRGPDGRLVIGFSIESGTAEVPELGMAWQSGAAQTTLGLDLVATLDVDGDGAAEIAWLNGDVLEIWGAESGLQMSFGP